MDLEKFLELLFTNPDNISIQYSNINGKEKLIVNGKDLLEEEKTSDNSEVKETYDDSEIKEKIALYKEKIEKLDDYIFEKVIDEAEKRHFNLCEMNKGLELEHYTPQDELYAINVIQVMSELIQEVIKDEIQKLVDILEEL